MFSGVLDKNDDEISIRSKEYISHHQLKEKLLSMRGYKIQEVNTHFQQKMMREKMFMMTAEYKWLAFAYKVILQLYIKSQRDNHNIFFIHRFHIINN